MRNSHIWYSLCIQDIQDVAKDNIDRELTEPEMKKVIHTAGQFIPYWDTILSAMDANGVR